MNLAHRALGVFCLACGTTILMLAQTIAIDFGKEDVGKPPQGFSFALTGRGRPGVWVIQKDDATRGNVLAQMDADATDYRFPLALYDAFTATADRFVVTYDGQTVLDAKDSTFKDGGKVGLWTKADSVIYFDDFSAIAK